jgi:hypothetical protein
LAIAGGDATAALRCATPRGDPLAGDGDPASGVRGAATDMAGGAATGEAAGAGEGATGARGEGALTGGSVTGAFAGAVATDAGGRAAGGAVLVAVPPP